MLERRDPPHERVSLSPSERVAFADLQRSIPFWRRISAVEARAIHGPISFRARMYTRLLARPWLAAVPGALLLAILGGVATGVLVGLVAGLVISAVLPLTWVTGWWLRRSMRRHT